MSEANYGMVLISSLYLIVYYFFNIFLRVKEKRIIEEGYNNMDFINTCVRPKLIYNSYNIYILNTDDVAGSIMNPRFLLRARLKGVQGNAAHTDISFKK